MTTGPEGVSMSRRRAGSAAQKGGREAPSGRIALASTVATLLLVVATAALFTVDGAIGGDPVSNVLALVAVSCYAVIGGLIARGCRERVRLAAAPDRFGLVVSMGAEVSARWRSETDASTWPVGAVGELVAAGGSGLARDRPVPAGVPDGTLPSRRWRPSCSTARPGGLGVGARMVQTLGGGAHHQPARAGRCGVHDRDRLRGRLAGVRCGAILASSRSCCGSAEPHLSTGRRSDGLCSLPSCLPRSWSCDRGRARSVCIRSVTRSGSRSSSRWCSVCPCRRRSRSSAITCAVSRSWPTDPSSTAPRGGGDGHLRGGGRGRGALAGVAIDERPRGRRRDGPGCGRVPAGPSPRHRLADRLVYGDRASPYELVATFTERLDEASLTGDASADGALVAEGTGAQRVGIWLHAGRASAVAGWPSTGTPASCGSRTAIFRAWGPVTPSRFATAGSVRRDQRGDAAEEPMTPATERLLSDLSAKRRSSFGTSPWSRSSSVPASDSSPRRTRNGGGSSAICTTARSSGWSRSLWTCGWRANAPMRAVTSSSRLVWPPRSRSSHARCRAPGTGAGDPPGDPDADRVGRRRPVAGGRSAVPVEAAVGPRTTLLARGRGDGLLLRVRGVGERSQARAGVFGVGRRRGWRRTAHHRGGRRRRRWRGDERGLRPSRPRRPRGGGGRAVEVLSDPGAGTTLRAEIPCG